MFAISGALRKPDEYGEARRLRRDGMPMKQIAGRLSVSPGSVHRWTHDIKLTAEQRVRNMARNRPGQPGWILTQGRVRKARAARVRYQREGRVRAQEGDPLHVAGCMLYWAEGTKSRNRLQLINSDPEMVRFFCRFVRTCFDVSPGDFRVALNFYTGNGLAPAEIEGYWLGVLDLPRTALTKSVINALPTSSSGTKTNRLPYAVCKVAVRRSVGIVQHIYGAIQEYVGSEEPRWLD